MAEKKDFMSALAEEVSAKKRGERTKIDSIDDFVSTRHENKPADVNLDEVIEEAVPEEKEEKPGPVQKEPEREEIPQKKEIKEVPRHFSAEDAYDSDDGTPDSFQEEKLIPVSQPRKKLKKGAIIGLIIAAAAVVALIWFFAFAPKITMPDFVGKKLSDVSTWARQNKMESSAIATSEPEYSLEYDKDVVMAQSVEAGKKIKSDTPITLTISAGPDPSEKISFPDLKSMTKDEIQAWIDENKLSKAKISTEYSTTVEEGKVISYDLKNVAEDDFTRGTSLTIKVSKGTAPAGQVTMENFAKKTFAEAETWATQKKLNAVKVEQNSDTVEKTFIISQSVAAGQTVDEGTTITFVVSKGKGILVPNLVGYTAEQLDAWEKTVQSEGEGSYLSIVTKSVYNELPEGSVVEQSIAPNTTVDSGSVLELTISLYLPILETDTQHWIGQNYLKLKEEVDKYNAAGADIQAGEYGAFAERQYSDTIAKDGIIEIACSFGTSNVGDGCERPLNLNSRIAYRVSLGPKPTATPSETPAYQQITLKQSDMENLSTMQKFCNDNSAKISCSFSPVVLDTADKKVNDLQSVVNGSVSFTKDNGDQTLYNGAGLTVYYYVAGQTVEPAQTGNQAEGTSQGTGTTASNN